MFILSTADERRKVSWSQYQSELKNRAAETFLYDDITARIYHPSSTSWSAGRSPMMRSIILHLAHNNYPAKDVEIADELNDGQRDPAAAVRQAIRRINIKFPDLIISTGGMGYLLNPDIDWLVVTETGT